MIKKQETEWWDKQRGERKSEERTLLRRCSSGTPEIVPTSPGLTSTKASEAEEKYLVVDKKTDRWARARLRPRCRDWELAIFFFLPNKGRRYALGGNGCSTIRLGNYRKICTWLLLSCSIWLFSTCAAISLLKYIELVLHPLSTMITPQI